MGRKQRIVIYSVLTLIAITVVVFVWLEYSGRTHIIADYYAPQYVWSLTDGDALSAKDIQRFIQQRNPNVENIVGLKLSLAIHHRIHRE